MAMTRQQSRKKAENFIKDGERHLLYGEEVRHSIMQQNKQLRDEMKVRKVDKNYRKEYTEKTFANAIDNYFDFIEEKNIMPTKEHFAKWLGYSKFTIDKYIRGYNCPRWQTELLVEAYDMMNAINKTAIYTKDRPIGEIFMAKADFGMVETTKVELGTTKEVTIEDIDAKIKELSGN